MSSTGQLSSHSAMGPQASADLRYRRIVVKAGTSVLAGGAEHRGLDPSVMGDLVRQIYQIRHVRRK